MTLSGRLGPRTLWVVATFAGIAVLSFSLFGKSDRRAWFLPGVTTHGHHQIELQCDSCHSEVFSDASAIQRSCEKCHSAELREAHDSHPQSKFLDPRNADRVEQLDARQCVTCHAEHQPEVTRAMGLTLPEDYCFRCHQDVGKERPSHQGMAFDTCDDAGCHNFHDNRALYEDFLVQHLDDPDTLPTPGPLVATRAPAAGAPLAAASFDAPDSVLRALSDPEALVRTVHSRAGVNCSDCHGNWTASPAPSACKHCHETELEGFQAGRHGMRTALGLPPMSVAEAVVPMRAEAHGKELGCASCHGAHEFDTAFAASDACQSCHADEHTRSYAASPHAELFRREHDGELPEGSGVSCATCHLPRVVGEDSVAFVEHNQNHNLRPSEKMVRDVCLRCHGLGFSLDSLADEQLVERNFTGRPTVAVQSLVLAARRADTSAGSPAR